jgi:hypothetical protein
VNCHLFDRDALSFTKYKTSVSEVTGMILLPFIITHVIGQSIRNALNCDFTDTVI